MCKCGFGCGGAVPQGAVKDTVAAVVACGVQKQNMIGLRLWVRFKN